jgi:hypothetical protein
MITDLAIQSLPFDRLPQRQRENNMSAGYPSNEAQAGDFHSPDEFEEVQRQSMTAVEIGIIVGVVLAFSLVLFFIMYCRHMEQRQKAQQTVARLEEATNPAAATTSQQTNDRFGHTSLLANRFPTFKGVWSAKS